MSSSVRHKPHTIKRDAEIKDILSGGKRISTRYGVFFYKTENQKTSFRYAVLVKKNVGNAVRRNYCKRIVREYIRKRVEKLKIYSNVIFLFIYQGTVSYNDLQEEFDKWLNIK
jgi:ribonuclease P protein component